MARTIRKEEEEKPKYQIPAARTPVERKARARFIKDGMPAPEAGLKAYRMSIKPSARSQTHENLFIQAQRQKPSSAAKHKDQGSQSIHTINERKKRRA